MSFFIHLKATLVIVPPHITAQWRDEATKFIGSDFIVISIDKISQLAAFNKAQLVNVNIIILSSSVFNEPTYRNLLSSLSGGYEFSKLGNPRILDHHYQRALKTTRALSAYFRSQMQAANRSRDHVLGEINEEILPALQEQIQQEASQRKRTLIPDSTRKRARTTAAGASKTTNSGDSSSSTATRKISAAKRKGQAAHNWREDCFLNLSFARIIWDEYSYDNPLLELFVQNAAAHSKWLLSGTPRLSNVGDICNTAVKFGIHVARPESQMMPGLPESTVGPSLSIMSKSEQFHALSFSVKSVDVAIHRHQQSQNFVASYCRSNELNMPNMVVEERVIGAYMRPVASAQYYIAANEVADAGWDYLGLPSSIRALIDMGGERPENKGDTRLATALLVMIACGLGRGSDSQADLIGGLEQRLHDLERQLKRLFDKAMWLDKWLEHAVAVYSPAKRRDEIVVSARGHLDRLRNEFAADRVHLFTWLDFFCLAPSAVQQLDEASLRLLAGDLVELWSSSTGRVPAQDMEEVDLSHILSRSGLVERHAKPGGRLGIAGLDQGGSRGEGTVIDNNAATDGARSATNPSADFAGISGNFLGDLVIRLANQKPSAPTPNPSPADRYWKWTKVQIQEELLRFNVAFKESQSLARLKELVWLHEHGHGEMLTYRDGRGVASVHTPCPLPPNRGLVPSSIVVEVRETIADVEKTKEELAVVGRELRFARRYSGLVGNGLGADSHCDGCGQPLTAMAGSFLVVSCGHLLCRECRGGLGDRCVVRGCPVSTHGKPVLRYSLLAQRSSAHTTRAEEVAKFIATEIPGREHVVLFAQYQPMFAALSKALGERGITVTDLSTANTANSLEKFKKGKGGRVLLLDIDSEASAGSNLTIANHIIFSTVLMHTDPEYRIRTMRQARGRCARTGQTRPVTLYHFMAENTIEEATLRELAETNDALALYFAGRPSADY